MRRRRASYATPLAERTTVDVCVIGAGIAGLSIAYELARQGTNLVVLDRGVIGGGETGHTSAHLTNALDDRFYHLENVHGAEAARLAATSHAAAIDRIERNVAALGIECDFRRVDGYLFAAPRRPGDELERELRAAQRLGVEVDRIEAPPLPFRAGPALRFGNQARFEPLAYLDGLARAIIDGGKGIHTGVAVESVERGRHGPAVVKIGGGREVRAAVVVDATNASITSMTRLPLRQVANRSYVIAVELGACVLGDALYWDTGDPYHYLRIVRDADDRDLLLVGGEDHRTGQGGNTAERWDVLERWVRERCSGLGEVVDRWSGQIMEPADGLAFIGRNPDLEGAYVVSGDSGHGLTHGVIASVVIPELIAGHKHPWAELYDPRRSMLRSVGTLVRDAARSAAQYADWFDGGDVDEVAAIPCGAGAVVRRGIHMIAAYRDPGGTVHECSARCPHMSAVVAWNSAEQTWDCPAHGSRFDPLGRVLNSPALGDLAPPPATELPREAPPTADRARSERSTPRPVS